ncbi:methylmalonyl-CoA carboxyltransferase, partial [Microvirga sp. 3-52]|nr:methylmalonyl-CoA carboxyltransferase [Microvirga sp. 3-52]
KDEKTVLQDVRRLLSYLPQNNEEKPTIADYADSDDYRPDLADIVPYEGIRPYDIRRVIEQVVDTDSFMEVQPEFARNIVVGLSRIKGETVGLVCNQPRVMAGGLDIDSSDKAARFIRFC